MSTPFELIKTNEDGTIDDLGADTQWHIEEMDGWYYFGVFNDDNHWMFKLTAEDGRIVMEQYDGPPLE